MSTYDLRKQHVAIARKDVGKVEIGKNQGDWIKKYWPATSYTDGYSNKEPYCAAAQAYWLQQWLKNQAVLDALKMTTAQAEKWRCKSAAAFGWTTWAKDKGLEILPKNCILHMGDIVVYSYSHIEIVSDDDGTKTGPFTAIGANTNAAGSADGDGCFEKPRNRAKVREFIRLLQ